MPQPDVTRDHQDMIDLADRHSNDLDVVLLWDRSPEGFSVLITHRATGRTGRITASAKNALDVFNHPFAYAGQER
jgi:hypothetical protein